VLEFVRAWLFPPACVGCDAPGPALCRNCEPYPSDAVDFSLDGIPAFALGLYEGALREAVVAMKRGERDPLAAFVALLAARAPLARAGSLVPVPTTRSRSAQRGFDQSVELARRVAALRGVACVEPLEKRGRPQAGRDRRARLAAHGRFRLRRGAPAPAEATLLDDVCTTGSTLREAAAVLRAAGTVVRGIIVLARAEPDHATR
jgi:predicted amidophosphoribosyltransferase